MSAKQLFLDLDGVLADLYGSYYQIFGGGVRNQFTEDDKMWDNIREHGEFFRNMSLMPDAMDLWWGSIRITGKTPIILTGVPYSIPNAAQQKRDWVAKHFGPEVQVITCRSADKKLYGSPGDILVDDRNKYRHIWEGMGGTWVLHGSAQESLKELHRLYAVTL